MRRALHAVILAEVFVELAMVGLSFRVELSDEALEVSLRAILEKQVEMTFKSNLINQFDRVLVLQLREYLNLDFDGLELISQHLLAHMLALAAGVIILQVQRDNLGGKQLLVG